METRTCKNCDQDFTIEPEDFVFYNKIEVPPPTFCPECRMIRRFTWRNERSLYHRTCAATGKKIISCFSPESGVTVYERNHWWTDEWDPLSYGMEYDPSKPFFPQFRALLEKVPMPALFNAKSVNSEYTNHGGEFKNVYLSFASWACENVSYSAKTYSSKDTIDALSSVGLELSAHITSSLQIYGSAYVEDSISCRDSFFLFFCRGVSNSFGCTNLKNKQYYIFNEPYSKEEYFKKLAEFKKGGYQEFLKLKERFEELKKKAVRKYMISNNAPDCTGDVIANCTNCKNCFEIKQDARDSKYIMNGGGKLNDSYDAYGFGEQAELCYEAVDSGLQAQRMLSVIFAWGGTNVAYSYACHNNNNIFGCIGLRKKEYCILNKQYSKEEYVRLVEEIKKNMVRDGEYGEFFPSNLSPFAYNETVAQEYFPLSKEETEQKGYHWKEPEKKSGEGFLPASELPNFINDADPSILEKTIACLHSGSCLEQCTGGFKIIASELELLKRLDIPLPRLCPNCRHYARQKTKNPPHLYPRTCMCAKADHAHQGNCAVEFETSYAPERPETVYCETCYQAEFS